MTDDTEAREGSNPRTDQVEVSPDHLNVKVTDNQNEVFFKIKRTTRLEKLMNAFCERQGKSLTTVRFLFDGSRVQKDDTPDSLEMQDGDTLEVHQEQLGGTSVTVMGRVLLPQVFTRSRQLPFISFSRHGMVYWSIIQDGDDG